VARIGVICDREFLKPFDQRVWKEARTLADAGYDVEIITPHHKTGIEELDGIRVICCRVNRFPFTTALRLFRAALRGNYDLLHCHEIDPLAYALLLRPLLRVPVVWDCHEYYVSMKRDLQGPLAAVLVQLLFSAAVPRTAGVVTVDSKLVRLLGRWQQAVALPNYPRAADFAGAPAAPGGVPRIIYAGSLTAARGIRETLRAFRRLGARMEAELVVAGGFHADRELEAWCRDYCERHALRVEWLGWVDHRELAGVLRDCQLGLSLLQPIPRYERALPTKVFEYMLCGLPLLATQSPVLRRFIDRTGCGATVDSTDPDAIAAAMETLLASPDRRALAERGRRIAQRCFTWEAREGELLALYKRLLR
jgi:glycosyltransferase involved in cell wall biosynthesis